MYRVHNLVFGGLFGLSQEEVSRTKAALYALLLCNNIKEEAIKNKVVLMVLW